MREPPCVVQGPPPAASSTPQPTRPRPCQHTCLCAAACFARSALAPAACTWRAPATTSHSSSTLRSAKPCRVGSGVVNAARRGHVSGAVRVHAYIQGVPTRNVTTQRQKAAPPSRGLVSACVCVPCPRNPPIWRAARCTCSRHCAGVTGVRTPRWSRASRNAPLTNPSSVLPTSCRVGVRGGGRLCAWALPGAVVHQQAPPATSDTAGHANRPAARRCHAVDLQDRPAQLCSDRPSPPHTAPKWPVADTPGCPSRGPTQPRAGCT
jgi:hypothetical protein